MMLDLQPYSNYKNSGEPWIGIIPNHWQIVRTKSLLAERVTKGYPEEPLLAATQTKGVVRKEDYENRTVLAMKDLHLLKLVKQNDFVISLRSFQGGIEYAREQGIISPAYTVLYAKNPSTHGYLAKLFKSKPYVDNLTLFVTGIRQGQNIDYEKLSRSGIPIPPLDEQEAIVRFLDHTDRKIKRYIRAKQKLIKLLNEQKQAIIHQAVTRGLDPNVRLKPSGVEWLGDVPEHWEIRRVKSLSQVKRGASPRPINDPKYFDENGEYSWVRISDVTASERYLLQTTQRLSPLGKSLSVSLEPGSLFLSIAGSVGKPIITKIKCCIHDGFVYFPQIDKTSEFLLNIFSCGKPFARLGKLGTQLNLNTETVGNIFIGWPKLEEQVQINQFINENTKVLNETLNMYETEISLIKEYRNRLITDIVTGKVDIRETAAHLPEYLEEPYPDTESLEQDDNLDSEELQEIETNGE